MRILKLLNAIRRRPARFAGVALGLGLLPALAACATIMHGSSQEVAISSTPTGARVTIDGLDGGQTPVAPKLSRKDQHTVRIELAGYKPWEMKFTRSTSGWVWGNIVFGGLPGLAVDAITGGLYKLKPDQVQATLAGASTALIDHEGDRIVVAIVMKPIAGAELVGQIERE